MVEVRDLTMISDDRPSQWEGKVGDRGSIYIRYRWGELGVYLSDSSYDASRDGALICEKKIGGKYDGRMGTAEMVAALVDVCRFLS